MNSQNGRMITKADPLRQGCRRGAYTDVFTASLRCNCLCRLLWTRAKSSCSLLAHSGAHYVAKSLKQQATCLQHETATPPVYHPPSHPQLLFLRNGVWCGFIWFFGIAGFTAGCWPVSFFPFYSEVLVSLFIALMLLSVFTACLS